MTLDPKAADQRFLPAFNEADLSAQMAVERTRLLYQGSLLPTLLMLVTGLVCSWLMWGTGRHLMVSAWLVWLMSLIALRVIQVAAFDSAIPDRQAQPMWRKMFLIGSAASGLTLAMAAIVLAPTQGFIQQAWIFGLLGAAALSASIAYAVSFSAFLSFVLPCLVPPIAFMLSVAAPHQRGWGWLGLMLLGSLCIVAWQVNRLFERGLHRRFQNQALIEDLQREQQMISRLNKDLAAEVERRRCVEEELRLAHAGLEGRVAERSLALDAANQALKKSEARLALALQASELGLWDWNLRTDEVHHTELERLFGLKGPPLTKMLKHLKPRLHPDDVANLTKALIDHFKGRTEDYCVEYRIRHADGHWLWIEDRGRAVERTPGGRVLRMLGTRRDISERKHQAEQQRLAATVFGAMSEGIAVLDTDFHLLALNQAFTRITGYEQEDCIGKNFLELPCSLDARRHFPSVHLALEQRGGWQGELVEARKNGELYPQWFQVSVIPDDRGTISHLVVFLSDLSARRASEEHMHFLRHHDELTGLSNRGQFRQRLFDAAPLSLQNGRGLALLHINLDRFKVLNETLSDQIADQVLQQMAKRISQALPQAHTVARLGGDEFAALLDGYTSLSSLVGVTTRLLAKIRAPLKVQAHELVISASIGISLMPENARDPAVLINQSSIAMQAAKRYGGDNIMFYTDSLQPVGQDRLSLELQLRRALEERQLEVFYQPKLNLATGLLDSVEALVRWRHPERGLIAPVEFIAMAEEIGLIGNIGEFVLRQACWQACEWQRMGLGQIRVSVNLAEPQLRTGNLLSLVRQALQDSGLAAPLLELEVTESQWLNNLDAISGTFDHLRAMGVKLSIDDFGTGYSSLSYLKRLPVDYVKIDQLFIRDLTRIPEDAAITQAMIGMAHALGLKVVAEGVETVAQLELLKAQGCDEVQGYLLSPPVPAQAMSLLLGKPGKASAALV